MRFPKGNPSSEPVAFVLAHDLRRVLLEVFVRGYHLICHLFGVGKQAATMVCL
jgi:hypothetical protein